MKLLTAIGALFLAGCASTGAGTRARGDRGAEPAQRRASTFPRGNPALDQGWTISGREQVDAWLHGFAMVMKDTTHVPIFARGYRQNMEALERQKNVTSQLTANADRLAARFTAEPTLINAQFVPMYFASFDDLLKGAHEFLDAQGDLRSTTNPELENRIAIFAEYFPTASDREWLQVFLPALQDDYTRFYHDYWTGEQARRAAVMTEVSRRWNADWYPALRTYLSNTQQGSGEILLSLPLAGEGRTTSESGITASAVAFPDAAGNADDALYSIAHEIVQQITNVAIGQNGSLLRRQSDYDVYGADAAVRGGEMLLARLDPAARAGYMAYYLRVAGEAVPSGDATAAFEKAFPLPKPILDAIARQLENVLAPA